MIFINLIVILLYIMLAVFSRKNHSKYKGNIFKCMADVIYEVSKNKISYDGVKRSIRKVQTVSPKGLIQLTKKHMVESLSLVLCIFLIFNLISAMAFIKEKYFPDNENIIEREGYQGDIREETLYLNNNGEELIYTLDVSQLQYTEEEFICESNKMFLNLKEDILGENISLENVCFDLTLPEKGNDNVFSIKWKSDTPDVLTSHGKVNVEELKSKTRVVLTATAEYLEYTNTCTYEITVCPYEGNVESNEIGMVGEVLDSLEMQNRNKKYIEIPDEIDGVKISLTSGKKSKSTLIFCVGFLISFCTLFIGKSKLDEAGKLRDSMLKTQYPAFVNKFWLLLGTGMTIKACVQQVIDDAEEESILIKELEYTINQIESGCDESLAYDELGTRLSLGPYRRLMSHLSQNLRMGTKDLLKLMEEEVRASLELKKEDVKRKGEEASTKLLFPMILLLATVMLIVVLPALISF